MAKWSRKYGVFFFLGIALLGVQGCTTIDNYWLGKDNTPVPGVLKPIMPQAQFKPCWTVSLGQSKNKDVYLHLRPALENHMIYVATEHGLVKAIAQKTGQVKWSKQLHS